MRTHYDNLHVSEKASPEVIRAAYKALAQKWHPDKNAHQLEKAERYFKIISKAFEALSDPSSRAEYDTWLASTREANKSAPEPEPATTAATPSSSFDAVAEARQDGQRSREQGFQEKDCPYRDSILRSAWLEGFYERAENNETSQPLSVKRASMLLWWVIAIGIFKGLVLLTDAPEITLGTVFIPVVILAFSGLVVSEIAEGKNWARICFLAMFIGGTYFELLMWSSYSSTNSSLIFFTVIQFFMQAGALVALFSAPAKTWFAGQNATD